VNETFARRYFPGSDPLGKRVHSGDEPQLEIIGIVRDSNYSTPGEETWPLSVPCGPYRTSTRSTSAMSRSLAWAQGGNENANGARGR